MDDYDELPPVEVAPLWKAIAVTVVVVLALASANWLAAYAAGLTVR